MDQSLAPPRGRARIQISESCLVLSLDQIAYLSLVKQWYFAQAGGHKQEPSTLPFHKQLIQKNKAENVEMLRNIVF